MCCIWHWNISSAALQYLVATECSPLTAVPTVRCYSSVSLNEWPHKKNSILMLEKIHSNVMFVSKSFSRNNSLTLPTDDSDKSWRCIICSKLLSRKTYLTPYSCTPTDEQPFRFNVFIENHLLENRSCLAKNHSNVIFAQNRTFGSVVIAIFYVTLVTCFKFV